MASKLSISIILSIHILFAVGSIGWAQECIIIVKDMKQNNVQFRLQSTAKTYVSENGKLVITSHDRNIYFKNLFTFEFVDPLTQYIYEPRLKNQKGEFANKNNDRKYTISELCTNGSTTTGYTWFVPDMKRGFKY
jgi:hypothetical protein